MGIRVSSKYQIRSKYCQKWDCTQEQTQRSTPMSYTIDWLNLSSGMFLLELWAVDSLLIRNALRQLSSGGWCCTQQFSHWLWAINCLSVKSTWPCDVQSLVIGQFWPKYNFIIISQCFYFGWHLMQRSLKKFDFSVFLRDICILFIQVLGHVVAPTMSWGDMCFLNSIVHICFLSTQSTQLGHQDYSCSLF